MTILLSREGVKGTGVTKSIIFKDLVIAVLASTN